MDCKQQGAVLVIVLMLLVAVTITATLAVRHSLVALSIATHGQAQQLLLQNSDAAIFNIENHQQLMRNLAQDGMFGMRNNPVYRERELVFCFKGSRAEFFSLSEASMIYQYKGHIYNDRLGMKGYCRAGGDHHEDYFFTSRRRIVLTQISIRFMDATTVAPFQNTIRGTDERLAKVEPMQRILVSVTSLMPTLSRASTSAIDRCLNHHLSQASQVTVSDCLTGLNVPFTTHVTEYTLGQVFL